MYLDEIGLHALNLLTLLSSIINVVVGGLCYDHIRRNISFYFFSPHPPFMSGLLSKLYSLPLYPSLMAKDLVEGGRPPRDSRKDRSKDLPLGHMAKEQTCDLTNTKEEVVLKKVAIIYLCTPPTTSLFLRI